MGLGGGGYEGLLLLRALRGWLGADVWSGRGVQEEAADTPASARHKRGCNCKKSLCLKKYCECYQVI